MMIFALSILAIVLAVMTLALSFAAGRHHVKGKPPSEQPEVGRRLAMSLFYALLTVVVAFCAGMWA